MLDPQVIQALITILVIIRLLEVTRTAAVMQIKRQRGTMAVIQVIPLNHIQLTPQIPVVLIVLVLQPLRCNISNTTRSGQIITIKQK
ncbi:hypothetical protein RIF29_23020 [Crotalaria pallida]|uniref:Uncharacterized protein n=1 Tax=Crotalaria pallida TaxID=3830 RepID=A0AAN9I8E2_CROPI